MAQRSKISDKVIVVADRGYESYNVFAHIEKKDWNYVIRVKDACSNGMTSTLELPDSDEYDVVVHRLLTRKNSKEVKANPQIYRFIPSTLTFDFLEQNDDRVYPISFRVVRIKLDNGKYETLITNLDAETFPAEVLKQIYALRWGIMPISA